MPKTLSLIGPGNVGQSLARMFVQKGNIEVNQIVCRNLSKGQQAQQYIQQGAVITDIQKLEPCDIIMIATPDDVIEHVAKIIPQQAIKSNTLLFHCSGALNSNSINANNHPFTASAHPLNSFSQIMSLTEFKGTMCAIEGESTTCKILRTLFEEIGGRVIQLKAEDKIKWHLAASLACNNVNALIESSLQIYNQIGLSSEMALQALNPILTHTLNQNIKLGPANALTGPIARGDTSTVSKHLEEISDSPELMRIYQSLGAIQLELSLSKKQMDSTIFTEIKQLLNID